ncbi:MAG: hypothetical protein ACOX8M_04910 [Marvinbryantia sp.]
MDYSNFVPVIGTVININRGTECCNQRMSVRTENGTVNFIVVPETLVIDSRQIRPGMRVAAFYDADLPVPLIFPPQYRAQIVTTLGRDEQIMLNYFDRNLTAADNSLRLNVNRSTRVETVNGQNFPCNPANQALLVYYSATTRSIPPQTAPRRLVVLCQSGH